VLAYDVRNAGDIDAAFTLGGDIQYRAETQFTVASIHDAS
jgi:hypothetical protein